MGKVGEIPEKLKQGHAFYLEKLTGDDPEECAEFVNHLWSDPDRRYDYWLRQERYRAESPISQQIGPGLDAEIREHHKATGKVLAEGGGEKYVSLLKQAGVVDEVVKADVAASFDAFHDCMREYLGLESAR